LKDVNDGFDNPIVGDLLVNQSRADNELFQAINIVSVIINQALKLDPYNCLSLPLLKDTISILYCFWDYLQVSVLLLGSVLCKI